MQETHGRACLGPAGRGDWAPSTVNVDVLKSFAAIAASGSLSKTAEQMRVSQSTVTRQVQSLEQEIGGRLFERSHSGVALTAAGQALYRSLRRSSRSSTAPWLNLGSWPAGRAVRCGSGTSCPPQPSF